MNPTAEEEQRKMFAALRKRGEEVVTELLKKGPASVRSAVRGQGHQTTAQAFEKLNADGDDVLTVAEIYAYPVLDEQKSLGELLNITEIMGFGAGGETFDDLSIALFDLQSGLPAVQIGR